MSPHLVTASADEADQPQAQIVDEGPSVGGVVAPARLRPRFRLGDENDDS